MGCIWQQVTDIKSLIFCYKITNQLFMSAYGLNLSHYGYIMSMYGFSDKATS